MSEELKPCPLDNTVHGEKNCYVCSMRDPQRRTFEACPVTKLRAEVEELKEFKRTIIRQTCEKCSLQKTMYCVSTCETRNEIKILEESGK